MRILFVTPQMPHPTQGGAAIRNWHLMRAAAAAGHTVHLMTPDVWQAGSDAPPESLTLPAHRRTRAHRVRDLVLSREPDLARRLGAHRLRPEIARRCREQKYDLIQVEGLEMWPSIPQSALPVIYDAHNAEATLQARMARQARRDRRFIRAAYSAIQARKLRWYEANAMRRAACTLAVSASDAAHLRALNRSAPVKIVPIGVDTTYYAPDVVYIAAPQTDVVFTGTFDYRANDDAADWFVRHVWPRVRSSRPNARCALVGRNPSERLRACDGRDGITVTGSVPDDRPFMAAASVYILPMRFGSGVRVKLLNAMSMGCAVDRHARGMRRRWRLQWSTASSSRPPTRRPLPLRSSACSMIRIAAPRSGTRRGRSCPNRTIGRVCTPRLLAVYADLERAANG